jgi:membrane peptidoglycan carboxypeptidase
VATSLRQPGSSFKPLVYAAAIQNAGIGSGTFISDEKTAFTRNYIPNNSDNTFKGDMIVRHALAWSRNIPAIKAFYIAGEEEKLLDFLDQVGIHSLREFKNDFNEDAEERGWTFHYGPAMAIGSGELTLLELVGGYSVFANGGKRMPVNPVLEIRDRDGEIIEKFDPESGIAAVDPQVAFIINNILSDVYARPGGSWRAGLTIPGHTVAAKTGTSNKKVGRTNYPNNLLTIGYTPSIAVGAWVGNSDGSHLHWNSWGLTGAAPIWKAFMTRALEGKEDEPFPEPEGLIWRGREVYPSWFEWRNHDAQFKKVEEDEEDEEEIIKPEESDFVQSRDRDPDTGEVIKNEPVDIPEIPDKIEDSLGGNVSDEAENNSIPYGF